MTKSSQPPFLPFARPLIDEATIAGVAEVLRSGWITSGPQVAAFEEKLSDYFTRPTRVFNSGSCTMEIALRLAGIGAGDEVITTSLSWVATSNVILAVGARPVFVDVDPRTRNVDLAKVEEAISPKTRAIMPVYLSGLPIDMNRLYSLAAQNQLRVIEDAAQALGSRWGNCLIGSFGDFASFSFQANKNITTAEGGCLVLPSVAYIPMAEKLRLQGVVRSGLDAMEVDVVGGKYNMTDVAARIGLGQFEHLAEVTAWRASLVENYFDQLEPLVRELGLDNELCPVLPPRDSADEQAHTNWHMFQLVLPLTRLHMNRADFMREMRKRGIGTGVHYPPIHLFKLYRQLGWKPGDLPVAEHIGRAIVTLPLFASMSNADVVRVCDEVKDVFRSAINVVPPTLAASPD